MHLVKQRESHDCGVAAVATYLELQYDQLGEIDSKQGLSSNNLLDIIKKNSDIKPVEIGWLSRLTDAILLVPSLNSPFGKHWVVWSANEQELLDPLGNHKTMKSYQNTDWYTLPRYYKVIVDSSDRHIQEHLQDVVKRYTSFIKSLN